MAAAGTINWQTLGAAPETKASPKSPAVDNVGNKETFLKLLVAQIKHQNPLNPSDGMEFVSQLAQFTELEQLLSMRQDIGAIRTSYESQKKEQ